MATIKEMRENCESNNPETLFERICVRFNLFDILSDKEMENVYINYYSELLTDALTPMKPLCECIWYKVFTSRLKNGEEDISRIFTEWLNHYVSNGVYLNYDTNEVHDSNYCERIG